MRIISPINDKLINWEAAVDETFFLVVCVKKLFFSPKDNPWKKQIIYFLKHSPKCVGKATQQKRHHQNILPLK